MRDAGRFSVSPLHHRGHGRRVVDGESGDRSGIGEWSLSAAEYSAEMLQPPVSGKDTAHRDRIRDDIRACHGSEAGLGMMAPLSKPPSSWPFPVLCPLCGWIGQAWTRRGAQLTFDRHYALCPRRPRGSASHQVDPRRLRFQELNLG